MRYFWEKAVKFVKALGQWRSKGASWGTRPERKPWGSISTLFAVILKRTCFQQKFRPNYA